MAGSLHAFSTHHPSSSLKRFGKTAPNDIRFRHLSCNMADQHSNDSFSYSNLLDAGLIPDLASFPLDVPLDGVPNGMAEFEPEQSEGKPEASSKSSAHNSVSSSLAQSPKPSSTNPTVTDHYLNADRAVAGRVSSSPTQPNHGQYLSTNSRRKSQTSPSGGRRGSTAPLAQNHTFSGITKAATVHHTRSSSMHRNQDFRDQEVIFNATLSPSRPASGSPMTHLVPNVDGKWAMSVLDLSSDNETRVDSAQVAGSELGHIAYYLDLPKSRPTSVSLQSESLQQDTTQGFAPVSPVEESAGPNKDLRDSLVRKLCQWIRMSRPKHNRSPVPVETHVQEIIGDKSTRDSRQLYRDSLKRWIRIGKRDDRAFIWCHPPIHDLDLLRPGAVLWLVQALNQVKEEEKLCEECFLEKGQLLESCWSSGHATCYCILLVWFDYLTRRQP
jgi:hypothetical protein